jgi:hypothetical protein
VSDNHIVVPADPFASFGEMNFLDFLQSLGYTLEYRYDPVKQA